MPQPSSWLGRPAAPAIPPAPPAPAAPQPAVSPAAVQTWLSQASGVLASWIGLSEAGPPRAPLQCRLANATARHNVDIIHRAIIQKLHEDEDACRSLAARGELRQMVRMAVDGACAALDTAEPQVLGTRRLPPDEVERAAEAAIASARGDLIDGKTLLPTHATQAKT